MANLSSAIANWQKRQAELQAQQVDTEKVQLQIDFYCPFALTAERSKRFSFPRNGSVLVILQKQPAKRRSSAATKTGGARGIKAAGAATLATAAGTAAGGTGAGRQDWRTAKVQKAESAVPIGKQLKVRMQTIKLWSSMHCHYFCRFSLSPACCKALLIRRLLVVVHILLKLNRICCAQVSAYQL